MFRLREKSASLCRIVAKRLMAAECGRGSLKSHAAIIARAVHLREAEGLKTTLRQLHKITQLSQAQALKAVAELERSQMLAIDRELHDVLESRLTLTKEMRDSLDEVVRRDAA